MQDKLIKKIILMVGIIAVLGVASSSVVISSPASAQKGPEFIPGRYIVVLQDGVSPQDVIRGHGVVPDFVYSYALNGFSAPISPKLLNELKQDPRVVHIEQDQKVYAFSQTLPTGIDRIDAEPASSPSSFAGDVTVAIIDTGIDFDHPDLNVVHKANCAKKGPLNNICFPNEGDDGNGHGTHVAGTVAGKHNTIGVVGVVPGADLWAVKVLGNDGSGWMSWVIAGVDYVTANANSIDVANMSLGGSYSQALNDAVENSISAGVVYAVAAGNASDDADNYSPASAPNAITVSAIVDTDGMCGGQGSSTKYGADDTFASFSNYGSIVDIAAPGVSILSTYKDGGYATGSGTSMASPHVAGAAALYIYTNGKPTNLNGVTDVRDALVLNGIPQTQESCTAGTGNGPFSGDGNSAEPLVYVVNTSVNPSISIDDVILAEGDAGTTSFTFTITRSSNVGAISVDYTTSDGTTDPATAGVDYTAIGTTQLSFVDGGVPSKTITVSVIGDTTPEPDETFFVNLTNCSGCTISDSQGVGTITNDDFLPSISIDDVILAEGDTGTTSFTFTITRSSNVGAISVDYATADGTGDAATQPSDYTAVATTPVNFLDGGALFKEITIDVNGDTDVEPDENFAVNLSSCSGCTISDSQGVGTITNDDFLPSISIDNITLAEGNSPPSITPFVFAVSRDTNVGAISLDFATADGTATAGSDYTALPTTNLSFIDGGVLSKTVTVFVDHDLDVEPDETFFVNLTNCSGCTISDNQGVGTITNDDTPIGVTITSISPDPLDRCSCTKLMTIEGSGFGSNVAITITGGDGPAPKVSNISATDVQVTFDAALKNGGPRGPSTWTVTVTNTDNGTSDSISLEIIRL